MEIGNGIVNVAVDIACTQAALGHDVAFFSSGGEYEGLLEKHGVRHHLIKFSKSPLALPGTLWRFRKLIKAERPCIVHAHMMSPAIVGYLGQVFARYALITHVHNEFQRSARIMGVGDRVIAVSQSVMDSMSRRGISSQKLALVRNGTIGTPRRRKEADESTASLKRPSVVTIAGLYARKGIADLLRAFEALPKDSSAHLYIVGDGPDRGIFRELAESCSSRDRIHFEGFQRDPHAYVKATDIFVLASHREPFGLVLAEAREGGCAIIASRVDGIPEALDDGQAGLLFPPGDVPALTGAMLRLLEDTEFRRGLAKRASENVAWLTVSRMTREVLEIYEASVKTKRSSRGTSV